MRGPVIALVVTWRENSSSPPPIGPPSVFIDVTIAETDYSDNFPVVFRIRVVFKASFKLF